MSATGMHAEGLTAYAQQQAAFYVSLQKHFNRLWVPVPVYILCMHAIINDPSIVQPGELEKKKGRPQKTVLQPNNKAT